MLNLKRAYPRRPLFAAAVTVLALTLAAAHAEYPRAGWSASLSTHFHGVSGAVTIINDHTLLVEHFNFDGGGPAVYFYLGATDAQADFANGLAVGAQLTRAYSNESVVLTLPPGQTLDDYGAVSVWCADFQVNFGSGAFVYPGPPYARRGWVADIPHGSHQVQGVVTIVNERILSVEHFTYDGLAPAAYFYLGATNTYNAFLNGLPVPPQLQRAYADEPLVLTLPAGQTLEGYGAVSVWCAAVLVNFSSAPFVGWYRGDLNCDGVVDFGDINAFVTALIDPSAYAVAYPTCEILNADMDGNGSVGFEDINPFVAVLTGPGPGK